MKSIVASNLKLAHNMYEAFGQIIVLSHYSLRKYFWLSINFYVEIRLEFLLKRVVSIWNSVHIQGTFKVIHVTGADYKVGSLPTSSCIFTSNLSESTFLFSKCYLFHYMLYILTYSAWTSSSVGNKSHFPKMTILGHAWYQTFFCTRLDYYQTI